MDYPERFFSRMFADARGLELARRFAVWACMLLFLIAVLAGAIFWARRSQSSRPYFLRINDATGEWIAYGGAAGGVREADTPWFRLMQESLAVNFASGYLRISDSLSENADVLWCRCAGKCDDNWDRCKLCCASDAKTFERFYAAILPTWREKFGAGEFMEPVDVRATPLGEITELGGFWRVEGTLISNRARARDFVAFVRIGRVASGYSRNLGFHVADFDFYVVEK